MAGYTLDKFEPVYVRIEKKAHKAYLRLLDAMEENPVYPCLNNPYYYMDYDGWGFESEDYHGPATISDNDAEALCYGCPLIKQCYDYAISAEIDEGIWGGINFGTQEKLF